jgi:hypothetical protein
MGKGVGTFEEYMRGEETAQRVTNEGAIIRIERIAGLQFRNDLGPDHFEITRGTAEAEAEWWVQPLRQRRLGRREIAKAARLDIRIGVADANEVSERQDTAGEDVKEAFGADHNVEGRRRIEHIDRRKSARERGGAGIGLDDGDGEPVANQPRIHVIAEPARRTRRFLPHATPAALDRCRTPFLGGPYATVGIKMNLAPVARSMTISSRC